jgi:hypothetical protein
MFARISSRGRYRVSVALVGLALGTAQLAQAQNSRSWVSGVGDDANPCTRTAPCKTFAGAISKTAPGGTIDALDPGGFGALTITKALTIEGGLWNSSILVSGTNGIVVAAGAGDVVILRNLVFESFGGVNGGLNGIRFVSGGELHVEHVSVTNFNGYGIDFEPSSPNSGSKLFVDNTSLRHNGTGNNGGGVYVINGEATIDHLSADGNSLGVRVGVSAIATVSNSVVSGGSEGFTAANDPAAVLNINNSTTTHNDFGIVASQGATVRCNATTIINNGVFGLFNDGVSTLISFGNNVLLANSTNGAFTATIPVQ